MRKIFCYGINLKVQMVVFFLLVAGFALRMYDLGIQSLWLDESISSIAAMAFLEKGIPVLPSGFLYDRSILNTFLISLSFKIFGINEFTARLPSVLFGILTILLVYFIGSKWGNKKIGIIAAFLVTFSVWEIAWSRQARMYQQLQFFYILSLYLFYEFTVNKSPKKLALLALSALGAIMSHEFGYVLIPVFLVYLIISALKERDSIEKDRRRSIAAVALALVALLGFAYLMGVIQSVIGTQINYYNEYIYLLKKDLGIFLFLAVPGGTVLVNRDWRKGLLLISGLIIPLYFIFFHVLMLGTRYLYFVVPILFILVVYFLDFAIDCLSSFFVRIRCYLEKSGYVNNIQRLKSLNDYIQYGISEKAAACVVVAFLLIIAMYFSPAFTFTPSGKYDLGVNAPQSDFRDAYMYVKDNMRQDDVIISAWTPPAQFYLGKSDYWLEFNVVGTGAEAFLVDNSSRDIYTNATAIPDVKALKKVVDEHPGGWVIVDGVAWNKLRPSTKDFIKNNLTFYIVPGNKMDIVEVYGWYYGEN